MNQNALKFDKGKTAKAYIEDQIKKEGLKDKHSVRPIKSPTVAGDHTPAYLIHRYYARRPHNVFNHLIRNYTNPGDIVLDPFCGGGVTVVEALRTRRKAIGVDLNPLATFITKMEVAHIDIEHFRDLFFELKKRLDKRILNLYKTKCHICGAKACAEWFEWSQVYRCPHCHRQQVIAELKKTRKRSYVCSNCKFPFEAEKMNKIGEKIVRIKVKCSSCKTRGVRTHKPPDKTDLRRAKQIEKDFAKLAEGLWYPKDKIPKGDETDRLLKAGYTYFYELFTKRTLLGLSILLKGINDLTRKEDTRMKELFSLLFSSTLIRSASKLSYVKSDQRIVNAGHHYWTPLVFAEINVWQYLEERRFPAVFKGKEYSEKQIGKYYKQAYRFSELANSKTALVLTASSDNLPIPDRSVDIIITDPPFGGNVNYAELSDFWTIWLKNLIKLKSSIVEKKKEVVINITQRKNVKDYEESLYGVFKQMHRVLKDDCWMVLTFHSAHPIVWMSLHRAANRAGFRLPPPQIDPARGMMYQPAIEEHTTTLHQQAPGAMLGDFVLSFQKKEVPANFISGGLLNSSEERDLKETISNIIDFHYGADESTIMEGLVPYLQEKNLFLKLANFNFKSFLERHFEYRKPKWYNKTHIDKETSALRPVDFIPAEHLTEQFVYDLLKEKGIVSFDEILILIYTNLVNAHRPGIESVNNVLKRLCDRVKMPGDRSRYGFRLKPQAPKLIELSKKPVTLQIGLFGGDEVAQTLSHDEVIEYICSYAIQKGFDVHVGQTEQDKNEKFKKISRQMLTHIEFGIDPDAFATVKEIDVLLMKKNTNSIIHAFEVATTIETANKAVNDRYRNLLAVSPNINIKLFLVVRKKDFDKARRLIFSPVNVKDGLDTKIKILQISSMTKDVMDDILTV